MSYFSTTLTRLLTDHTQSEIAEASGIPRGTISLYASGARGISVGALGQLLQAFPSREDQLDLVRAHLRDEIPAEVYDAIDVVTRSDVVREDPPVKPWAKDLDAALEQLRVRAIEDPDVRRVIFDLSKLI